MKKIIYLLIAICVVNAAHADMGTGQFRDALLKCDDARDASMSDKNSTNDMNQVILDASNCYVKVGNAVIKKFYADTAEDTGKKFAAFANAIYSASQNLYSGPDECYPECGQISTNLRINMTEAVIKRYITDMLDYIDTLDV
ncbi:MAG: hypothetical protein FWG18_01495 [Alphaproteobacteria bacterium]|nr:hypothetical protein [Alphaproteobacteria bacterium]